MELNPATYHQKVQYRLRDFSKEISAQIAPVYVDGKAGYLILEAPEDDSTNASLTIRSREENTNTSWIVYTPVSASSLRALGVSKERIPSILYNLVRSIVLDWTMSYPPKELERLGFHKI
jgi:hypothetical protein